MVKIFRNYSIIWFFFFLIAILIISSGTSKFIYTTPTSNERSLYDWPCDPDIIVPDDFLTIQEAIDAANTSDCIGVRSGTYYEIISIIDKSNISIFGEHKDTTIIDGNNFSDCIMLYYSDNIYISNFTIRNTGPDPNYDLIIDIFYSDNCTISNCIFKDTNACAVCLNFVEFTKIVNCKIDRDCAEGIILQERNFNNKISNCTTNSIIYGITLFKDSENNIIEGNHISTSEYGILLYDNNICNNVITKNNIERNKYFGLLSYTSNKNIIYYNNFVKNGFLVRFNAWDLGCANQWYKNNIGNYWSDYHGFDLFPKDGIGDIPYFFFFNKDPYPLMKPFNS